MTLPPHPFFIALQFLTTIPVRLSRVPDEQAMGRSLLYYPLVGLLVGGLLSALLWGVMTASSTSPAPLLAAIILTLWVLLTGGLHLDGLADSTDALMGGIGDRQRTLDLMKDPTSGPMGVLSLLLVLLIKFTALQALVATQNWQALLVAPLMGRSAVLALFLTTPYVRPNGLGALITTHMPRKTSMIVLLIMLAIVSGFFGWSAPWLLLSVTLVFFGLRTLMMHHLGGTTGDTAGALVELIEMSVLVMMVFVKI